MKKLRVVRRLEALNSACIGMTQSRMKLAQIAVLSSIALMPGATSGDIVRHTGLSLSFVGYILKLLCDLEEVKYRRMERPKGEERKQTRRFVVTVEGKRTLDRVMRSMGALSADRYALVDLGVDKREEWAI